MSTTQLRPYVTDLPARHDVDFRTNDDKQLAYVWLAADRVTPVEISSAVLTLVCDVPPYDPTLDPPEEPPIATRHVIDSTTPDDPNGWIDTSGYTLGQIVVVVPLELWATIVERSGNFDLVATRTSGLRRCLVRGIFVVEQGVSA